MKRVWSEARAQAAADGWSVLLDGKALRIPGGPALSVPHEALAEAVAAEWQIAGVASGEMTYADVPLTRLAGTAQSRIVPNPVPTALAIAAYGETDLLCYRAANQPVLLLRQAVAWDPWLDWSRVTLGAALQITAGLMHVAQHPSAIAALRDATLAEDGWSLAGLGVLVPALGSLVLGLAVARGALQADAAFELSRVDEQFQSEVWGLDEEAETRRVHVLADVVGAAQFINLVRG